ncbi:DJ-1 [Epithele typhae]|uniref:DJ-1 n=1 Tax=Epithele typhae TaxID=378194 RepID=UPI002008A924|nr:DJ-1 [Epithele typhae]KAH9941187.1 DJ-1 [Epithele typhae]
MHTPSALILIANGTEEMELYCTSAFVPEPGSSLEDVNFENNPPFAKGSRGIRIVPDTYFSPHDSTPDNFDVLVIPGGAKGAQTMSESPAVQELVRKYLDSDKFVGMVCAGSLTALTSKLPKQSLTSHPSVRDQLKDSFEYSEDPVVCSGKLITSSSAAPHFLPGTTFPFALTLVELLCGKEKRSEVAGPMVFPAGTFA